MNGRGLDTRFSDRVLKAYVGTCLPTGIAVSASAQEDGSTEILLFDEIGYFGVTAKDFVLALAQAGDGPITLRINSPGGDVFDGLAIYNALRARTSPVNVIVDGLAASAASFIAMAGTTVSMCEQSLLMVHNAWAIVVGDRNDMLDMAAVMEKIDSQLAAIYAGKSGKSVKDVGAMMDAETWFTSSEAKDAGLCDVIAVPAKPDAKALASLARIVAEARPKPKAVIVADASSADEDDDDDSSDQAVTHIQSALGHLTDAIECINGGDDDDVDASARRRAARAAATTPEWIVSADENLPIDDKSKWDGPAAAERMLDAAGFNGDSPDPAKARRGFLTYDHHNPKLKGSYKLPFADLVDGGLKALKSGIDAAASRLPDTDIPDDVKTKARAVIDGYEKKMKPADDEKKSRLERLARAVAA